MLSMGLKHTQTKQNAYDNEHNEVICQTVRNAEHMSAFIPLPVSGQKLTVMSVVSANIFYWIKRLKKKKGTGTLLSILTNQTNLKTYDLKGKRTDDSGGEKKTSSFHFLLAGAASLLKIWDQNGTWGHFKAKRRLLSIPSVWTPSRAAVTLSHLGDPHPAKQQTRV